MRVHHFVASGVLAFLAAACASTPEEIPSITAARAAIQQVESSPLAGEAAAKEVDEAHQALHSAEEAARKHRSEKEINNLAYSAKRHAEIAQEQVNALAAKRAEEKASDERQAILLDAREREAQLKTEQADRAKAEAEAAKLSAQQERLTAEQERERSARLEEELRQLNAKKTERGYVLTLGDVLFDTAQATLKPGAMSTIDRLSAFLKEAPDRAVVIEGHTDSVGSDSYNQDLSERRARAVQEALQARGVPADRIQASGKGEGFPVASNDSASGRQQNRRVEIVIEGLTETSASTTTVTTRTRVR